MLRGLRGLLERPLASGIRAGVSAAILLSAMPTGCSAILGIDAGKPYPADASLDSAAGPENEASSGFGGYDATALDASEGGGPADGTITANIDSLAPVEASTDSYSAIPDAMSDSQADTGQCTSQLDWCNSHCGTGPDNCGQMVNCGGCDPGDTCNSTNVCLCATAPDYCAGRCGKTTDNCGQGIDCGECEGGTCYSNVCNCIPETTAQACGNQQCGQAMSNCNLMVNCGVNNTTACPNNGVCQSDGTCCTPNNVAACGNQCGVTVTNNCGQTVDCPSTSCAMGEVCYQSSCCTPVSPCSGICSGTATNNCDQTVQCSSACANGQECGSNGKCCAPTSNCGNQCNVSVADSCGVDQKCSCPSGSECTSSNTCCVKTGCSTTVSCEDNCGVSDQSCCSSPPPVDSGPGDSSSCLQNGATCTSNSVCCMSACATSGSGGVCANECLASGASCSTATSAEACCYPSSCQLGVMPGISSGSIVTLGTCQ